MLFLLVMVCVYVTAAAVSQTDLVIELIAVWNKALQLNDGLLAQSRFP